MCQWRAGVESRHTNNERINPENEASERPGPVLVCTSGAFDSFLRFMSHLRRFVTRALAAASFPAPPKNMRMHYYHYAFPKTHASGQPGPHAFLRLLPSPTHRRSLPFPSLSTQSADINQSHNANIHSTPPRFCVRGFGGGGDRTNTHTHKHTETHNYLRKSSTATLPVE